MKKFSTILAMAALVLGVSSCSQDREPVYHNPTPGSFVLNQPEMADLYINLEPGEMLELTASQPDYGYSAICEYGAQMSLTEDFAKFVELSPKKSTLARMQIKQEDIAVGLCNLDGVETDEDYVDMGSRKVYFRATCQIPAAGEGSYIISNVVAYNHIKGYFAIPQPGFIYLVGAPEGWAGPTAGNAAHYADWRLFEPKTAIGSKVYSGVFDIDAGSAMFRFYTELTGWDADSYGSQTDDSPIDFEFVGDSFETKVVKGKGAFNFPDWEGGKMTVVVDMSDKDNMTFTAYKGEVTPGVASYIYLVGNLSGWKAPEVANEADYTAFRLADRSESGVYTADFNVPAGELAFRFALTLSDDNGWDNPDQIGSQAADANVDCEFAANGIFNGTYVSGKGNWKFNLTDDAKVSMMVDTNTKSVEFVKQ